MKKILIILLLCSSCSKDIRPYKPVLNNIDEYRIRVCKENYLDNKELKQKKQDEEKAFTNFMITTLGCYLFVKGITN